MRKDQQFEQWYKDQIESNPYDPPRNIWENIQDELDIENVWEGISHQMQKERRNNLFVTFSYAAAAAIILLLVLLFPGNNQPHKLPFDKAAFSSFNYKEIPQQHQAPFISEQEPDSYVLNISPQAGENLVFTNEIMQNRDDSETHLETLVSLNTPLFLEPVDATTSFQSAFKHEDYLAMKEEPEQHERSFYLGTSGELGKSWLLSNKTFYSITSSPYSNAKPASQNSFGFFGGLTLNPNWSLELEAFFDGNKGQIYREYMEGSLVKNRINLNYTSIQLRGRYRLIEQSDKFPVSHHLIFGTYMGYLGDASQYIEANADNIRSQYKNFDMGLVLGYELDTEILPNYILSTGFQIDPGIVNIYEGSPEMPAAFNKTYNASLSFKISLKYTFE